MTTDSPIVTAATPGTKAVVGIAGIGKLLDLLREEGYALIGPTIRDGAIAYDRIAGVDDLPAGWTDEHGPGTYRLKRRDDNALFGYVVGPTAWKKFLFEPSVRLWQADRDGDSFTVQDEPLASERRAFIGVRGCDMQAIRIQDKVFLEGTFTDPHYDSARRDTFILGVNCSVAGSTCFCDSMGAGPRVGAGADLVLTELVEPDSHQFILEAESDVGRGILDRLPHEPVSPSHREAVDAVVEATRSSMERTMNTDGIRDLMRRNLEHPRWDDIAERCLTCANCTMVCPTCFCSTVEDVTDLTGNHAERWRKWDSCFTTDFSYVHGGSVRTSAKSRYRQWLTHKLGSWIDQFGTSGCVGCGRCISWCPVGIDLTEEVAALRHGPAKRRINVKGDS